MATIVPVLTRKGMRTLTSDLYDNAIVITKSDTDVYEPPVTVYVGGAGVVNAVPAGDPSSTAVAVTVPAGGTVPFRCKKVLSTSTTATLMVGLS